MIPGCSPIPTRRCERSRKSGVKKLALVAPGFSADCLETLEELDGENRHIFEENGGEKFAYLPALNDSAEGIDVIEAIVRRELHGLDLSASRGCRINCGNIQNAAP